VSEQSLEGMEHHWPLVGISISVLATYFCNDTAVVLLLIIEIR
jgi:hypothetical protein